LGRGKDPGSPYSGVVSLFNAAVKERKQPTVFGDGEQPRDFNYVANMVEANLLACEAKAAAGLAINVGTGNRYTLNQTLALLEKITGRPAKAKYVSPREGDIRDSQADITRARNVLGYNPRVGFEEGLSLTWEWFLHQTGRTELDTLPGNFGTEHPTNRVLGEPLGAV
jgi:nucleoside-diphosphate-sugar epimerase